MRNEEVDVETPDGTADAYLSQPDGDGPHPGVLFIIDAFGLRPQIEEMADHIASHGYAVLAPNVFYRAGRAPVTPVPDLSDAETRAGFFESLRPLMQQLTPERVTEDGRAYLNYLGRIAEGPIAITGYCMGARLGWRIATTIPDRVAALAGFHAARLVTDAPDSPHLAAAELQAEVYFGHADEDPGMTPEQIAALDGALEDAGVKHRSEVYDGARHGYTMADTAAYDEAAAQRHFADLFSLLDRTIGSR